MAVRKGYKKSCCDYNSGMWSDSHGDILWPLEINTTQGVEGSFTSGIRIWLFLLVERNNLEEL